MRVIDIYSNQLAIFVHFNVCILNFPASFIAGNLAGHAFVPDVVDSWSCRYKSKKVVVYSGLRHDVDVSGSKINQRPVPH